MDSSFKAKSEIGHSSKIKLCLVGVSTFAKAVDNSMLKVYSS